MQEICLPEKVWPNQLSEQTADARCWYALDLEISPAAEEVITWNLWPLGVTGIETLEETRHKTILAAYFDNQPDVKKVESIIREALTSAALELSCLHSISFRIIPDEDWLRKWKEGYEPFKVGDRFLMTPSWKKPSQQEIGNRIVIEIDPGMAFGTGTHETTQLCLQSLEKYWQGGSFLDVGTGTGILVIAAALLQPEAYINAFDIDPNAVTVARENARINGVEDRINLAAGSIDHYLNQRFNFVVANLTIDILAPQLLALANVTSENGVLVMSGLLVEQVSAIGSMLGSTGLVEISNQKLGEWGMLVCRRG